MHFYKLDYALEKIFTTEPSNEHLLLKRFTGKQISEREAKLLWDRILDHKWHLSERLKRDVGFRVAAVDYIENFYEPSQPHSYIDLAIAHASRIGRKILEFAKIYFEAKGKIIVN